MHSPDFWTFVFLALVLKVPVVGVLGALWYAARASDRERSPDPPAVARMSLCGYCGTRVTLGYDGAGVQAEADRIAAITGEAAFDIHARLAHGSMSRPYHYPREPEFCPDCGERTTWVPIEPLDALRRPGSLVRPH